MAKMITQSDDTWAILKSLPDRPETVPRDYEFLPDAIERDIAPHGPKAFQLVRRALAEGDIVALLQGHLGHRMPVSACLLIARSGHPSISVQASEYSARVPLLPHSTFGASGE